MLPQYYETEIINSKKLSEDVFLLELKLPNSDLKFKAGQFVLVYQQIKDKEENRAFSIASRPSQNTIELLIKRLKNGKISSHLSEIKPGNKLKIRGPFGMFTVKDQLKELIFIAAGTGIAPLRSMVHESLEQNPNKRVSLIFGFRHENDYFFKEEFETLQKIHKNFAIHPCSSKPPENWSYLKGRVTNHIPLIIKSPENKHVYICGPSQMINDTLNILINQLNFQRDQIYLERWGID